MKESVKSLRIPRFRRFSTVQLLVVLLSFSSRRLLSRKLKVANSLYPLCFRWSCSLASLRSQIANASWSSRSCLRFRRSPAGG